MYDANVNDNDGDLVLVLGQALPRAFTFTAEGTDYSSADAEESVTSAGFYQYQWSAALSWGTESIPVSLSIETPKDGLDVTADPSGITDATDGVASANFHYEWIRVDGTDETETEIGATGGTYTPTADDVGKLPQGAGRLRRRRGLPGIPHHQSRGSARSSTPSRPLLSTANATVATTIYIIFSEPLDPASVPAASAFSIQVGGDTANTVDSVKIGEVIHGFDAFQGSSNTDGQHPPAVPGHDHRLLHQARRQPASGP